MSVPAGIKRRASEVESFTATEAQNSFGKVMERAMLNGIVTITKFSRPKYVILSLDTYLGTEDRRKMKSGAGERRTNDIITSLQSRETKAAIRSMLVSSTKKWHKKSSSRLNHK